MKFDQTAPCGNCPFRREGHIPLRPARARDIAESQLSSRGATFTCHKTTVSNGDGSERVDGPKAQHCAGALIFQLKNENMTQMVRIAGRLGMFDPDKLMANEVAVASVFHDADEMEIAHESAYENSQRAQQEAMERS